jgi:hypothetical protein
MAGGTLFYSVHMHLTFAKGFYQSVAVGKRDPPL